jgi:N-acetylglucosaminyldiphosphoundecaprenol N-acetyl-beta-D-mannosaminyltransferase
MSSPKKENFLARWGDDLEAPVCHGVGGAFDVLAGKVSRAPRLWQQFGMEWLYRVIQEPRRMWKRYLVTNSVFLWLLAGSVLRRPLGRRRKDRPGGLAAESGSHVPRSESRYV